MTRLNVKLSNNKLCNKVEAEVDCRRFGKKVSLTGCRMASGFRVGLVRLIGTPVNANPHNVNFIRRISSKVLRCKNPPQVEKPAPWPYTEKRYTMLNRWFDKTTARFDENTKVKIAHILVTAV